MANNVKKVNGIAIADIKKINTIASADLKKLNLEEFTATVDPSTTTLTNHQFNGTDSVEHTSVCYDPDNNFIIVAYRDAGNSNYGTVRAASISGTTLTWGSEYVFASESCSNIGITYNTSDDVIMVGYSGSGYNTIKVIAATVGAAADDDSDPDDIAFGSAVDVQTGSSGNSNQSVGYGMIEYNPTYNTATIFFEYGADSGDANFVAAVSVSGTACTAGTPVEVVDTSEEFMGQSYDPDITKTVLVYDNGTKIGARVVTQSGTGNRTIALGTEALYGNNSGFTAVSEYYGGMPVAYDTSADKHHVIFYDDSLSAVRMNYFTVSGTTVTWSTGTAATISSGTSAGNETGGGVAYNAARNRIITYGATATSTSSDYNFEYHTISGATYTSQGSATIIEEGLRTRSQHVPSAQTNAGDLANKTIIVYSDVGGSTGGGRVKLLDAGS